MGLARPYLIGGMENPFVSAYQSYQIDIAILLGADRAQAEDQLRDALLFEITLAEISSPEEERRDANEVYNKMTIAELQEKFPFNDDWLQYINGILPDEAKLTLEDPVVVYELLYFERLNNFLVTVPKNVVANYLMWRVVMESADYLSVIVRNRQQEFNQQTTGAEVRVAKWQECIDVVLQFFPHALGSLYVQKHFNENAKTTALEMVNYIKKEFEENLKSNNWMDEETRKNAVEKLKAMKDEIGFADEILDDSKLTELYARNPALNENQYFKAIRDLKSTAFDSAFKRLKDPNVKEWFDQLPPAIVMAYYSPPDNAILFPAGFLQGAFYSADRPQYTNYGGVGIAIGHEITHGFDDSGSRFDKDGNLDNWWAPETRLKFENRTKCIVDQFSKYKDLQTGLFVNGVNTQGENTADTGGVKYSYYGYQKWVQDHGEEPKLPGLNFSPNQLFWISVGQIWCSVSREQEMRNSITFGVHSPAEFRVIGPLHNSEEFSRDFNCPTGSFMNPSKCEVW